MWKGKALMTEVSIFQDADNGKSPTPFRLVTTCEEPDLIVSFDRAASRALRRLKKAAPVRSDRGKGCTKSFLSISLLWWT